MFLFRSSSHLSPASPPALAAMPAATNGRRGTPIPIADKAVTPARAPAAPKIEPIALPLSPLKLGDCT